MKETYYFAYGSNINLEQMAVRCPAAQVVGPAVLDGYELLFRGNRRGTGVATIEPLPGSHDYHADRLNLLGLASLQVPVRPNVTYANNICVHVEEVSLVLTTLWSAITLQKTEIEEEVVDYRQIYFDGKTISTEIVNRLHSESRAFLDRTFQMCNPNKTVVVTHYVPVPQATPERYVNSPVREAFIADCCDLIDAYQPAFWIHGHSHVSGNVQYGRTRIVSNQLGTVRPGKELNFNPKAVIEV